MSALILTLYTQTLANPATDMRVVPEPKKIVIAKKKDPKARRYALSLIHI